jgi:hypothetical protein
MFEEALRTALQLGAFRVDHVMTSWEARDVAVIDLEEAARRTPDGHALGRLEALDVEHLAADEAVRALQLASRATSHAMYVQARLAERIGRDAGSDDWAREEISAALNVSLYQSSQLLRVGRGIAAGCTATGQALSDGAITFAHAAALIDGLDDVASSLRPELERRLLEAAQAQRIGVFRRTVEAEVARADTTTFEERCAKAATLRKVAVYPDRHAMSTVSAYLRATDAVAMDLYLDAAADQAGPDDPRTRDQLRADALAALISEALAEGDFPTHQGLPVQLNITMTQESAFRQTDTPADLSGFGPIPASLAREMAADAEWRVFIIDAANAYLRALGTASYRPPQALREFLLARYDTCQFGPCGRAAYLSDLDHAISWPEGTTDETNCGPKCRRHHRCKHGTWHFEQNPDGSGVWTSPLGFRYPTSPRKFPVDP